MASLNFGKWLVAEESKANFKPGDMVTYNKKTHIVTWVGETQNTNNFGEKSIDIGLIDSQNKNFPKLVNYIHQAVQNGKYSGEDMQSKFPSGAFPSNQIQTMNQNIPELLSNNDTAAVSKVTGVELEPVATPDAGTGDAGVGNTVEPKTKAPLYRLLQKADGFLFTPAKKRQV